MPTYHLELPDGRKYSVPGPPGLTQEQVYAHVLQFERSRQVEEPTEPPPEQRKGFGAALSQGTEQFLGDVGTGIKGAFGQQQAQEAAREAAARNKALGEKYAPQVGLDLVKQAYGASGVLGAAKEVAGQVPLFLAQNAPQLAATVGGSALASKAASFIPGPAGIVAKLAPLAGAMLPNVAQFAGANLGAQEEATPGQINRGAAYGAAGAQAALDAVGLAGTAGRALSAKLFGPKVASVLARGGEDAAEKLLRESVAQSVRKGVMHGVLAEASTEVAQQVLERWQAGKSLTDAEALKEYAENAYGGALLGGALGPAGRRVDVAGARSDARAADAERDAQSRQRALQEQEAQARAQAAAEQQAEQQAALQAESDAARGAQFQGTRANEQGDLFDAAGRTQLNPKAPDAVAPEDAQESLQRIEAPGGLLEVARGRLRDAAINGSPDDIARETKLVAGLEKQRDVLRKSLPPGEEPAPAMQPATAAAKLAKLRADRERYAEDPQKHAKKLQALAQQQQALEEQLRGVPGQAPEQSPYARDLFDVENESLQQEQARAKGTQVSENLGQFYDDEVDPFAQQMAPEDAAQLQAAQQERQQNAERYYSPEAREARLDEAFGRVFATQKRSGMLDTLAKRGDPAAQFLTINMKQPPRGVGVDVVESLAGLQKPEFVAQVRALQQIKDGQKQELQRRLAAARQTGNREQASALLDGLRQIGQLEKDTAGRAHYTSTYYNVIGDLLGQQGLAPVFEQLGVDRTPAGPDSERQRATGRQQYQLLQSLEQELGGVESKRATDAMQAVADEADEAPAPRMVADAAGQGQLFGYQNREQVQQGIPARPAFEQLNDEQARQDVRGRIDKALATPTLTEASKGLLQRLRDMVGPAQGPEAARAQLQARLAQPDLSPGARAQTERLLASQTAQRVPRALLNRMNQTLTQLERGVGTDQSGPARTPTPVQEQERRRTSASAYALQDGQENDTAVLRTKEFGAKVRKGEVQDKTSRPQTTELEQDGIELPRTQDESALAQGDLFGFEAAVGRTTPARFQKALDTGALSPYSKRAPFNRLAQALRAQVSRLSSDVLPGLQQRVAEAEAAAKRLERVHPLYAKLDQETRDKRARQLRDLQLKQTVIAEDLQELIARQQAERETLEKSLKVDTSGTFGPGEGMTMFAAGTEMSMRRIDTLTDKIVRNQQRLARTSDSVKNLTNDLAALRGAELAPMLREQAARLEGAKQELAATQEERARLQDALLAAVQKRDKAQAKAPAAAAPVAPPQTRLPLQPRPLKEDARAAEKRERERVLGQSGEQYAERTSNNVLTSTRRDSGANVEFESQAVGERFQQALETPGLETAALRAIIGRVAAIPTLRGLQNRLGRVNAEAARTADQLNTLRRQNPGGMFPTEAMQQANDRAQAQKAALEQRYRETPGADARAALLKQMDGVEQRLREMNAARVPHEQTALFQAAMRRAELAAFERDMLELAAQTKRPEEAQANRFAQTTDERIAARKADELARKRAVEPGTRIDAGGPLLEKTQAKRAARTMPTRYSSKGVEVNVRDGATEIMRTPPEKRAAEDAQERRERRYEQEQLDTMGGEGGRVVERAMQGQYAERGSTLMPREAIEAAADGRTLDMLDSLATTGSSPFVRSLAEKLKPLLLRTRISLEDGLENAGTPVAGLYDTAKNAIRIDTGAATEEDVLHEAVHAATLRALRAPVDSLTVEQRRARAELERLLNAARNDARFDREYAGTNIEEFVSEVMANAGLRAKLDALPKTWWERVKTAVLRMLGVAPQTTSAKAVTQIERLFMPSRPLPGAAVASAYRGDGSATSAFGAALTAEEVPTGPMRWLKQGAAGLAFETSFVDQRAPLMQALSKGDQNAFLQAQYYVRKADARMAQTLSVLQHGPAMLRKDSSGKFVVESGNGPSAEAIFKAVGKIPGASEQDRLAKAQAYLVARRAANKGWDKLGFEAGPQLKAMAADMMREVKADPQLRAALDNVADLYGQYNKGLVQFLADTGAVRKDVAAALLKDNDYVPFYRVDPGTGNALLDIGAERPIVIGDIRSQPYLQQLKGDDTKLLPLHEAIMRNTMLLTDMGLRNLATKDVAYALQAMMKGSTAVRGTNVIMKGKAPAGPDVIKFRQQPDPKDGSDTGERWMRLDTAGTPFSEIPQELLVRSVEGAHFVMPAFFQNTLGAFGDLLRKGVTRSPVYVLRQLLRDPMSAAFTAGIDRGPIAATFKTLQEFASMRRGTNTDAAELARKGLAHSGIFTGDPDDLKQISMQLVKGDQGTLQKVIAMADRAAMQADTATRVQVYRDVLNRTGSEMQAELAAMEMMNFTKRGMSPAVQYAARMIPFLNAQVQSLSVLGKTINNAVRGRRDLVQDVEARKQFLKAALTLVGMSTLYALAMQDNEDYQNASAQERYTNFFIPLAPDTTIKLPIPYEVGLLFKALPEMAVQASSGTLTPEDWAAFRSQMFNTIPGASSLGLPQAIKPVIEATMNRSIYTGGSIEPESQSKLAFTERYGPNTSELAKGLSQMLDNPLTPEALKLSPTKIEYLVRGYFGGLPIAAAQLANDFLRRPDQVPRADSKLSQTPVFGALFLDTAERGAIESAYARSRAIEQADVTYKSLMGKGNIDAAQKFLADNLDKLASADIDAKFKQGMAELRKYEQQVQNANMDGARKRKLLDQIEKQRGQLSRLFIASVPASR